MFHDHHVAAIPAALHNAVAEVAHPVEQRLWRFVFRVRLN
jgi:hypothetical protein